MDYRHLFCCGASSKSSCTTPPCPCNIEEYSPRELEDLRIAARRAKSTSSISEMVRWESGV